MDEFSLIHRHFRPLAQGFPGALNLADDAACIDVPEGMQLIVTKDAITQGVHFLGTEDAALIARKLLRVNLSDLAAKGAAPLCYFLALMLPPQTEEPWIARFAEGLAQDQRAFGIHLAGGDTTAIHGPLSLCLTALGLVPRGQMLTRGGARAGDALYVSGTLGDAALGLAPARAGGHAADFLAGRYLLPEPRLALGQALRGIATACMDISDGLVQDLEHLCAASGAGAEIRAGDIPLSEAARTRPGALEAALSGGDDYELLFTVPPEREARISALPLPCTLIGRMTAEKEVNVRDGKENIVPLHHKGYRHFTAPFP